MKRTLVIVLFILFPSILLMASLHDAIGFWKSVDAKKGFTTSIMVAYEYEGKLYGQVIAGFDEKEGFLIDTYLSPVRRIEKLEGSPFLVESNLFWDLEPKESIWADGYIRDPRNGRSYRCDIWVEDEKLVVRGKLGPFGVRQLFYPATVMDLPPGLPFPDVKSLTPAHL